MKPQEEHLVRTILLNLEGPLENLTRDQLQFMVICTRELLMRLKILPQAPDSDILRHPSQCRSRQ